MRETLFFKTLENTFPMSFEAENFLKLSLWTGESCSDPDARPGSGPFLMALCGKLEPASKYLQSYRHINSKDYVLIEHLYFVHSYSYFSGFLMSRFYIKFYVF